MPLDESDLETIAKLLDSKLTSFKDDVLSRQAQEFTKRDAQAKEAEASAQAEADRKVREAASKQDNPLVGNQVDSKADEVIRKYEAKAKEVENRLKEAEAKAKAAEEQRKQDKLNMDVESALSGEFPGEVVRNVMARLTVDGRIRYTDDGQPGLFFQRNGYTETLPIADAVKEFAASDLGKTFLPPKPVEGSGDRINNKIAPGPTTAEGSVDWDALKQRAVGRLVNLD